MPDQASTGIIFISDLHLSADERSRGPDADDECISAFLDHLCSRAKGEARTWTLVLLGDMLDFLRVWAGSPAADRRRIDSSEAASLAKLSRLADAHRTFFAALGRFSAAGHSLVVMPGNHDVELALPPLQRRFAEQVAWGAGTTLTASSITFAPWIYYLPGLLYAEHGQQHHDLNAFLTLLDPRLPGTEGELDLPLGSHLEAWLSSHAGRPRGAFSLLTHSMACWPTLLGVVAGALRPGRSARRETYRAHLLPSYAEKVGLPVETVVALDELSASLSPSTVRRLLRQLLSRSHRRPLEASYLFQAARRVHRLLESRDLAVPFYVFGHTHDVRRHPLVSGPSTPLYLNCGGWAQSSVGSQLDFTFVEIIPPSTSASPTAEVYGWSGARGQYALGQL